MSIEQPDVVDFIGIDKATNDVTLVISDHLDWSDEHSHLLLLQEKINSYLRFVESGEIYESYPNAIGKRISIDIVGKHDLTTRARESIDRVAKVVFDAGFSLRYRKPNACE